MHCHSFLSYGDVHSCYLFLVNIVVLGLKYIVGNLFNCEYIETESWL
jgi:hypothetical protein